MGRRYIIFRADKGQPNWQGRKFAHTGAGTDILTENYNSMKNGKGDPKIGDRVMEFFRVEGHDSEHPTSSTHYRKNGDWEVIRIEKYTPEIPISRFECIYICYCKYSPINAPLKPLPPRIISVDSFGGDEKVYEEYMTTTHAVAAGE